MGQSSQVSLRRRCVCVCKCLIVHVDIKHLSSECTHTHSSHQWGFCNYKSIHPLHLPVFFSQSGCNVLRYLIRFFFFCCVSSSPSWCMNAPHLSAGTVEANTDPKWLDYEMLYGALKQTETTSETWCNMRPCQCWGGGNDQILDPVVTCQLKLMMRGDLDESPWYDAMSLHFSFFASY